MSKGKLFLILGPSGSGKGVTIQCLRKRFPQAIFPVSCTTRAPRPGEKDGEMYYFITKEDFQKRVEADEFLEWAVVHHDHLYGTVKKPILNAIEDGKIVIREVDIQGVQSIRKNLPHDNVCSIFITTASWEILRDRIMRRHKASEEELEKRRQSYLKEMEFSQQCDYSFESQEGDLDKLCNEICEILNRE